MCWDLLIEKYREREGHLEYSGFEKNWSMPCDEWFMLRMFGQRINNFCYIGGFCSYLKYVLEKLDYLLHQNEARGRNLRGLQITTHYKDICSMVIDRVGYLRKL